MITLECLDVISIVLILAQISAVIWVASNWKKNRRLDKIANRSHSLLESWPLIQNYLGLMHGDVPYYGNDGWIPAVQKFNNKHDSIITSFTFFLQNPEPYFAQENEQIIKKLKFFHEKIMDDQRRIAELRQASKVATPYQGPCPSEEHIGLCAKQRDELKTILINLARYNSGITKKILA